MGRETSRPFWKLWRTDRPTDQPTDRQGHQEVSLPIMQPILNPQYWSTKPCFHNVRLQHYYLKLTPEFAYTSYLQLRECVNFFSSLIKSWLYPRICVRLSVCQLFVWRNEVGSRPFMLVNMFVLVGFKRNNKDTAKTKCIYISIRYKWIELK